MERFINNRVTARVETTREMTMRYTLENMLEIVNHDLTLGIGSEAMKKCTRVITDDPETMNQAVSHFCYVFSKQEVDNLQKYIEELEGEVRHLRFEQNRYYTRND